MMRRRRTMMRRRRRRRFLGARDFRRLFAAGSPPREPRPPDAHARSPLVHFPLAQKRAPLLLYTETPDQPQSGGCYFCHGNGEKCVALRFSSAASTSGSRNGCSRRQGWWRWRSSSSSSCAVARVRHRCCYRRVQAAIAWICWTETATRSIVG